MKNIHVLPTDKPSRLFLNKVNKKLLLDDISNPNLKKVLPSGSYKNVYITNDEEIKEGDWFIHSSHGTTTLLKCKSINLKEIIDNEGMTCLVKNSKKIILTTDQDLIKDSVQAIGDEFLEWFVKNPSCEKIGVTFGCMEIRSCKCGSIARCLKPGYKIIIPKEEPKQETLEVVRDLAYYKANAEEDYLAVPISVMRYISQLEQQQGYGEAIDLFITEIKIEFKDENWDYLDFIKERVIKKLENK